MKKKTYALIQGIVGGVASIGIAATAINEICGLFVKNDLDKINV